ncbi:exopolysaccharide biosynthesis polyprenyl glycosylphosphotransferase [Azospirillum sp. B4]|uniref:exopolysaccharide biosynthesis polyprenyl glycosylphosphotransferase n=1 Tax=Azospirillum sp. B4 TaxID=95605 RepID=UPI00034D4DBA|nr:exopolysaccharide biosynthesis polyprenyl glycosylphosphotransferase [Azospirillum sp. B4]
MAMDHIAGTGRHHHDKGVDTRSLPNLGLSRPVFEVLWSLVEGGAVFSVGSILLSLAAWLRGDAAGDGLRNGLCLAAGPAYVALAWLLGRFARAPHLADTATAVPRVTTALYVCLLATALGLGGAAADVAWLLSWFALSTGTLILTRRLEGAVATVAVARRWRVRPAVIVGAGPAALKMVGAMAGRAGREVDILGFFDDRHTRAGALTRQLPYLGGLDTLADFVAEHEDIDVFMALPWTAGPRISALLERLRFLPITVWLVPDPELSALSLPQLGAPMGSAPGVIMPTLMTPPFSHWGRMAKTSFDYVAGLAILLLVLPVLLATAVAIKLDSPGPVFFRQQRSGQFGRRFSIYKFRSLHVADADAEAATLVSEGDARVTRVGRYIRKYSIDELPQILNVLRGQMSLVGPRPHAPKAKADGRLYADVMPDYALRYRVKPGMTGWAQVNGWRGETDTEEKLRKRVEFDFDYIRTWSFWLDMVILFRTLPAMLFPKNNV